MKLLFITISLLLMSVAANVSAQQKVVVMDPDAVLINSTYAKQKLNELQENEQYKTLVTRINGLRKELTELQEQEKVNSLTWSAEKKQSHRSIMQGKLDELNLVGKQAENERNRLLSSVQRELTPILEKVVTGLVEEKGFELILNSRAIIYSTEQNTITQMVIDALDKETAKNAQQ